MNTLHVKKGDLVVVLTGNSKGNSGKVLRVNPTKRTVVVEGVETAKVHQKARKQTDVAGIIDREVPIYACKVMLVCPKCKKPTRPSFALLDDGTKIRRCKKCKEAI
jgi:large subunit ribosomal protein L24